jgi:glycosyltransferase involved in cell wall biosynthesis
MSSAAAPFSVIIPAHNEAAVIGRCLEALLADAPADALPEIIVAANGCKDDTVAIARRLAPFATVLDLPPGSKVIAMNEASLIATAAPRFFLDADVRCSYAALAATAEALRLPGVMAASPALDMDVSRSDSWVRAYYRVWMTQPYVTDRLVGSGLFGLSAEGLARIGEIPPTFADDTWVRTRFSYDERRNVAQDSAGNPVFFTVSPPRTLRDQIRIEARRRIGSEQVLTLYPSPHNTRINRPGNLRDALKNGASVLDVAIYLGMKAAALVQYKWNQKRGKAPVWVRDLGARAQA